jgi:hypothetical protein
MDVNDRGQDDPMGNPGDVRVRSSATGVRMQAPAVPPPVPREGIQP